MIVPCQERKASHLIGSWCGPHLTAFKRPLVVILSRHVSHREMPKRTASNFSMVHPDCDQRSLLALWRSIVRCNLFMRNNRSICRIYPTLWLTPQIFLTCRAWVQMFLIYCRSLK